MKKMVDIRKVILRENAVKYLLLLDQNKNSNTYKLARILKIDYGYLNKINNWMKDAKLIVSERIGRENRITLTEKGKSVKYHLENILDKLKEKDES